MPATATGRGAQVVLDPLSDTAKAMRPGSIFIRTDGAAGARIYVNQNGAATWLAIATV